VVEPLILESYVATGDANFEFRNFAFLGDLSVLAAEATLCANDQGKYWEYHDLVFYNQQNPTLDGLNRSSLDIFARHLELDMESFTSCMDNHTHQEEVIQEREQAVANGVDRTPTIFLNGEMVTGIETWDDLFVMIEEAIQAEA
jgi:protein-disulfide isomerase